VQAVAALELYIDVLVEVLLVSSGLKVVVFERLLCAHLSRAYASAVYYQHAHRETALAALAATAHVLTHTYCCVCNTILVLYYRLCWQQRPLEGSLCSLMQELIAALLVCSTEASSLLMLLCAGTAS
jgi:hypothetical protein